MSKYTSNEQYERDKAALIRIAKGNIVHLIENADVIADFINQSKWIGADDIAQPLNYVDETTPSFKLQKAIEEAIEKAVEKALKSKI